MRQILAVAFLFGYAGPASAALLFYDGFNPKPETDPPANYNYRPGEILAYMPDPDGGVPNGQQNDAGQYWRRATAGTLQATPAIIAGSMSIPGLRPSVGNMVQSDMTPTTAHLARTDPLPALTTGNSWFWSGILRISNVAGLQNTNTNDGGGLIIAGFSDAGGPSTTTPSTFQGMLAVARNTADSNQYFLATGTTNNGTRSATTVPLSDGQTAFAVIAYDKIEGTNQDRARLWINPDPSTFGDDNLVPTPAVDVGFIGGTQRTPASFMLRNVSQTVGGVRPTIQFDEIRVGTTWADVTPPIPEPASWTLLVLGSLVACSCARR